MATEIKLPQLGEGLEGGDVLEVRVAPGDEVSAGQPLIEIEAEKSTVEVPAPGAGRVTQVLVKKGDTVKVGQTLCLLEGADGAAKSASRSETPAAKATPEARPRPAPEPAAPPRKQATDDDGFAKPVERKRFEMPPEPAPGGERLVPAGPATRRLARELGVDLRQVSGSATGGRVTQDDVKTYVRQLATGHVGVRAEPGAGVRVPPLPDFGRWGQVERKPLDAVRRKTAEQMALAWSLVPHVTQHDQVDITDVDAFRRQHDGKGPKLTITAFALKAAALALKQFPQLNATLDLGNNQLLLKQYYHLGVAVDTDRGLLVPVLRDVDKKSVVELAQEMADLAEKARQRKLQPDDLRGGTFTITNLGGIGGTGFTPIINWPEVAILGMARARLQPVVRDGHVVPRLLLPLSLSYDHRVIDGADAARFVRRIAEMLENPWHMVALA